MELSYQHPNLHTGKQSTLLRIEGFVPEQTVCILIDAGEGTTLLRLEEPPVQLEHGQKVTVRLPDDATPDTPDS